MGKTRKPQPRSKKKFNQSKQKPKKRDKTSNEEPFNKKAQFNRYRNKQRVEAELIKKKQLEDKFKRKHVSSESEEEVQDSYQQLLSTFQSKEKRNKVDIHSESESENDDQLEESENSSDDDELGESDVSITDAVDSMSESSRTSAIEPHTEEIEEAHSEEELEQEDYTDVSNDPFTKHLQFDLDDSLLVSVSSYPPLVEITTKLWPILGNLVISIPKPIEMTKKIEKKILLEEKSYAPCGTVPTRISSIDFRSLYIKSQLDGQIVAANTTNLVKNDLDISEVFTPLQKELFSIMNNYQDLYFPERTFTNGDEIRYLYCLHAVNHMLKTRTKILHHNAKLSKKTEVPDDFRDQGLVRPKVIIMVPFKNSAYKVVKTLIEILVPKEAGQVVNKNRFEEEFTGGELMMPKKNPKPEDYELLFSGNTDDTFRFGMTLTKKTLKLYTDFYSSDIIVASPLGLRVIVGAEGEEERDYDFLASVELLIMDQTDLFLMQNWDHLLHVLEHFHLQPKKARGTDFSRVRSWAVNGWSKYYRQTLIFSSVALPEINAIINKKCHNYAGKVRVSNPIELGSIRQVTLHVPQVFQRFTASDPVSAVEERFRHLVKEVLPQQRDPLMSHTLLYVPSYFDYVRIRNYFKKEDISFVQICEYSKDSKIARARDMFFHTEAHFLLYSERVHFFRRFRIKGIRHIIFYQPPTYPHFYSEMCNLMQETNQNKYGGGECNMTITTLYSKYDLQQLSAVVGADRTAQMIQSEKNVHMYMTGE